MGKQGSLRDVAVGVGLLLLLVCVGDCERWSGACVEKQGKVRDEVELWCGCWVVDCVVELWCRIGDGCGVG